MDKGIFNAIGTVIKSNEHNLTVKEELIDTHELQKHESQDSFDPLETEGGNESVNLELNESEESSKNRLVDEVIDAIFPRIKNPVGILIGIPENEETMPIKLKGKETQEQRHKRLLRHRILCMKRRFLKVLEMPDEVQAAKERATLQSRLRREKQTAMETPEETAARKQRQRNSTATARKRAQELETSEQLAERLAKQNEKKKLKYQEKSAKETPEERAARRQCERARRQKTRPPRLAMRTGKIRVNSKKNFNLIIGDEDITKQILEAPSEPVSNKTVDANQSVIQNDANFVL